MEAALHPDAFGQILNRIWLLMRANLKLFLAVAAPPVCAMLALYTVVMGLVFLNVQYVRLPITAAGWTVIAADCVLGLAGLVASIFVFALYEPAVSYAALQLDAGHAVTFREAYGVAWSKAGRYVWLLILRRLIIVAPAVLPVLIFLLSEFSLLSHKGEAVSAITVIMLFLAVLLYLGAMAWAILASIRLVLAQPASLVENLPAWDAIRRSNTLTRGGRLRVFLIALVLYAVTYGATMVCELAFGIIGALGAIPVLVLKLGPAWWVTGLILLVICFICALLFLSMEVSSAYSVAFAILYREQVRLQGSASGITR